MVAHAASEYGVSRILAGYSVASGQALPTSGYVPMGGSPLLKSDGKGGIANDSPRPASCANADPKFRFAFQNARSGGVSWLKRALAEGFDPASGTGGLGTTALMLASLYGRLEAVNLLLDAGSNPVQKAADGGCALNYSVGHLPVLNRLLDTRAREDIDHRDCYGTTGLMRVMSFHDGNPFKVTWDHECTPVRAQCIDVLMAAGARIDAQNIFGRTALMNAAYSGSLRLVEALLRHGARADLRCEEGKSALEFVSDNNGEAAAISAALREAMHHKAPALAPEPT